MPTKPMQDDSDDDEEDDDSDDDESDELGKIRAKEKAVKIQKERRVAQRAWRNRLRPRSVLRARM